MRTLTRIVKLGLIGIGGLILVVFVCDYLVKQNAEERLYNSVNDVPHNRVGLFLGCGKYLKSGYINRYYSNRINAAANLFKAGKIEHILVSGDNSRNDYDEPSTIKDDLIAAGIPADKIHLDYAGFRTLDSVVRAREIFGQQKLTIISQPFHNERALFIADKTGVAALGFNAKDVSGRYGFKTQVRERLARVKMMMDLVFGVDPKFLGEKIEIK